MVGVMKEFNATFILWVAQTAFLYIVIGTERLVITSTLLTGVNSVVAVVVGPTKELLGTVNQFPIDVVIRCCKVEKCVKMVTRILEMDVLVIAIPKLAGHALLLVLVPLCVVMVSSEVQNNVTMVTETAVTDVPVDVLSKVVGDVLLLVLLVPRSVVTE